VQFFPVDCGCCGLPETALIEDGSRVGQYDFYEKCRPLSHYHCSLQSEGDKISIGLFEVEKWKSLIHSIQSAYTDRITLKLISILSMEIVQVRRFGRHIFRAHKVTNSWTLS
jgi:hypothetical protein